MKEVLLVSSDGNLQKLLSFYAEKLNILLVVTNDLGKAWNKLNLNHKFLKIILDVYSPGQDSLEFAKDMKKFFPGLAIVGLTTNPLLEDKFSELFKQIFLMPFTTEDYIKIIS